MASLDDYSDEEIGRMVRAAARGREREAAESIRERGSFARFLENIGLFYLADLIRDAAAAVWEGLQLFLEGLFYL